MRRATILVGLLALVMGSQAVGLPRQDLRWLEVATENFVLLSSASPDRTRDIADTLERFRTSLLEAMPAGSVERTRAWVFVFGSSETLHPYNLRLPSGQPGDAGGYCISTPMGGYIAIDATPGYLWRPVIYHEYVHQLMFSRYDGLPLWFHEGIAEYFSTLALEDGRVRVGYPPQEHVDWLREHPAPMLQELFATRVDSPGYHERERAGAFYAGSWLLTHYLLHDGGGSPQSLSSILGLASPDRPFHDALLARLGGVDAASALRVYGTRKTFDSRVLAGSPRPAHGESAAAEAAPATVLARLGLLLAYGLKDYPSAEAHLRAALALDAARIDAAAGLGYALELQGRADEAAKVFGAALELRPDDPELFHVRGRAALGAFEAALSPAFRIGDAADPRLLEAQRVLRRCAALAPEHFGCLSALGRTFRFAPGDVTEGVAALERALARRPQDEEALSNLAVLYARSGVGEKAERLLRALERSTRRPELVRGTREAVSVSEHNFVWQLANDGRVAEARALLGRRIAGTADLALRRELEAELGGIVYYGRYADAVRMINERRVDEALALLRELDSADGPPDVKQHVRELLEELRRATGK